jgi:hypothetical protein
LLILRQQLMPQRRLELLLLALLALLVLLLVLRVLLVLLVVVRRGRQLLLGEKWGSTKILWVAVGSAS